MYKPRLMPGSLYPLYKRFLNPKEPTECHACHRPLDSGAATFLAVDEKPQPFGPKCARKFALEGSFRDLPDLMKDVMLVEDMCSESVEGAKKPSISTAAKELMSPRPCNPQTEIYKFIKEQLFTFYFVGANFQPWAFAALNGKC